MFASIKGKEKAGNLSGKPLIIPINNPRWMELTKTTSVMANGLTGMKTGKCGAKEYMSGVNPKVKEQPTPKEHIIIQVPSSQKR